METAISRGTYRPLTGRLPDRFHQLLTSLSLTDADQLAGHQLVDNFTSLGLTEPDQLAGNQLVDNFTSFPIQAGSW